MSSRRWRFDHLVAVVEAIGAVVGFVILVAVGIDAQRQGPGERTAFDRVAPFVAAVAIGAWLSRRSLQSWRQAEAQDASARGPGSPARGSAPPPPGGPGDPGSPALSSDGERELPRVVSALAAAGVFAPETPDPDHLREAAADHGEPLTADVVLAALEEADHHRPDFRRSAYTANLAFHGSHAEQDAASLRAQVDDVVRLCGSSAAEVSIGIELSDGGRAGDVATRLRLVVGGVEQVHDYLGAPKYLSTHLHVALARALRADGRPRLAWLWSDRGVWLSGLGPGMVERLNTELGAAAGEGWGWVDEAEPIGADRTRLDV